MRFFRKRISIRGLIIFFSLLSVVLLVVHHLIFHENGYWANFLLLHEIALMPLEFVVVTLGLEKIMELTHKRENQAKISMIESVFFSESGSDMLRYLVSCDADGDVLVLQSVMDVKPDWTSKERFIRIRAIDLEDYQAEVKSVLEGNPITLNHGLELSSIY